jgi:hypothetical protein
MRTLLLPAVLLAACGTASDKTRSGDTSRKGDEEDTWRTGGGEDDGDGTGGGTGDTDAPPVGAELSCSSAESRLDSDWDAPQTAQFSATGVWSDGRTEDVTAQGTWSVGAGAGGSIDAAGRYTAPPRTAGPATVQITWEGLVAECGLDTYLDAVIDLTGDAAIEAAVGATAPSLLADCAPYVLYPLDGALIPADFFSPNVQWIPVGTQDVFVITFETTYITLRAITRDSAWTPEGTEWWAVADPDSGTHIDMTVLGGSWDATAGAFSDGLCGSPWSTALQTAWWGAQGSVFYWTPSAQGLWQVDVGAETASPWMDQSNTGQCVGCHSVNYANPTLLAVTVGSGGYGALTVAEDSDPLTTLAGGGRTAGFSTLDPTGTRLVRSAYGVLYLDDLSTDVQLGTVPTSRYASHPNWSPDGRWLAYSSCAGASGNNDWSAYDCDLRVLEVLPGDTWGADTLLAQAPPGQSYYYPSFSPDSNWVAFNRHSAGASTDTYDEGTAELMLMPRSGGAPIVLATANGLPNVTNSWPRWGPIVDDIGWLAYGSRRPYALQTDGIAQVWVAGVDLAEAAAGNHTPAFVARQTD